jgi:hypothetical protein
LIVLLSGELSYLDEHSLSLFDFKLPLPILQDSVARFSDWFLQQKEDKRRTRADSVVVPMSTIPNTSIQMKRDTSKWRYLTNLFINTINELLRSVVKYVFFLGDDKFQWNSLEVYYKWRLLNPTKSISFHNTQLIYAYSFLILLKIGLSTYIIAGPLPNSFSITDAMSTSTLAVYGLKEYIYKYFLTPFKIKLRDFMIVLIIAGFCCVQFVYYEPLRRNCREVEDINYVPIGRSLNETLLACDMDGYRVMRFLLSGGVLLAKWSTWTFPRYGVYLH